jgi:hypothetical protein
LDSIVSLTRKKIQIFKILFLRIPSDFPWPKLDQSISINPNRSSRIPLGTITNQPLQIRAAKTTTENILSVIKTENHLPIENSSHQFYSTNDFNVTSTIYSDELPVISRILLQ